MKIHHKKDGAVSMIIGMCLLVAITFILYRRGWFVDEQSNLWLVRYSIPIVLFNIPILLIVSGIVMWLGISPPYNAPESTPASRAKASAFAILITLPMWTALSLDIYTLSDNAFWIIAWTVFMGYLVFLLVRGITKMVRPR
jgi:hypothetical protein